MSNRIQLTKFQNVYRENLNRRANGDHEFAAKIVYELPNETLRETLNVVIHNTTWEGGQIDIEDGGIINIERVHCRFLPKHQVYNCSPEGFLTISDRSPTIGKYKVTIIPI